MKTGWARMRAPGAGAGRILVLPGRRRPLKRGSDLSKHDFPDLPADTPQHPIRAVGAELVGWARAIRATESAQAEAIILRTALPNSL